MTAPARVQRSRLRTLALNMALATASALVALLMAEALVRLVIPQQLINVRPDIWAPADTVGWIRRPQLATTINTGERPVELYTDDQGFRVGAAGPNAAETQVLLLGDSFLAALQVPYESSTAGLLEARLTDELERPVAVRNAAVDGWDPNQYYWRARALLARFRFDLVVVGLYLGNDVVLSRAVYPPREPAPRPRLRFPRTVGGRELVDAVLYPLNAFLEARSHLFVLVKTRLEVLLMRVGLTAAYFPQELRVSEATSRRWEVTADLLAELADLAREHGTEALFVLIPAPHQVDDKVFRDYVRAFRIDPGTVDLEQPNRLLAQTLTARDLTVADVLGAFRQAHRAGVQLYGAVDRHLSPAGHRLLVEMIAPAALRRLPDIGR